MTRQLLNRIVVGVDGSDHAAAALEWAIKLSRRTGAEVIAVYGVYVPVYATSYSTAGYAPVLQYDPEWRHEMQRAFEGDWCATLRSSGIPFRTVFKDGRPASVIADTAEELDADLVVVGRRGRGTLTEIMLGSVSHELSHHCKRPVLLISQPAESKTAARRSTELAAVH